MPINSRQKGKRVELWMCKFMNNLYPWLKLRRAQQYKGAADSADIESENTKVNDTLFFESKGVEKLSVYAIMERAKTEAEHKLPILLWKKNHKDPLMVIYLSDLPKLVQFLSQQEDQ